ncbi:hypothetical protein vseg_011195 [Gypsophila vaccaria]
MVKGEDVKAKKKNKKLRKKLNRDPSTAVSARVASIIAAKKRRHTGKRRQCQGMCFSLPTPEDPFNDRRGKEDTSMKKGKKPLPLSYNKDSVKDETAKPAAKSPSSDEEVLGNRKARRSKQMETEDLSSRDLGCPSKFLCNCLNFIRDNVRDDDEVEKKDLSWIANPWGFEFWKSFSLGRDIFDNSGTGPSVQKIAWIASTAADNIQQKDSEHTSVNNPFLLYLVSSQEKALKVRAVCKPLKRFGIHTVSVHAGSSLEHQINGLKKCDPEFIVATPERLWELVKLKEINMSAVALLVVDAMDSLSNCIDVVKCIRDSISGNPLTVIFSCCRDGLSSQATQLRNIIRDPAVTLSLDDIKGRQQ